MRLPELPSLHFDNENVKLQMGFLTHWLKQLLKNDFVLGQRVEIDLTTDVKRVPHNLGRLALGWIPLDLQVKPGNPFVMYACAGWDRQTIAFHASGEAKLSVWVF